MQKRISMSTTVEAWTEGVKLPPEPQGTCSPALQESINKLYDRKIKKGYDTVYFMDDSPKNIKAVDKAIISVHW